LDIEVCPNLPCRVLKETELHCALLEAVKADFEDCMIGVHGDKDDNLYNPPSKSATTTTFSVIRS